MVDVILRYSSDGAVRRYQLSGTLDPGLPDQENTANLVLDYGPGGDRVLRATGLLYEPLEVTRSRLAAAVTFVKEGFRHILEGLDHVLFVLCMVLGALTLGSLVWRVTGFTLGHSVTLTLGFFGFVPAGSWFIPTVEIIIALTIIYAALVAMFPKRMRAGNNHRMFVITAGIGLLHGLGFSFVLHKILQVTSPDIWQSLLAFNVGIEIGQLAIILVAWPLFLIINRMSPHGWTITRNTLATLCILVAAFWTWERSVGMLG